MLLLAASAAAVLMADPMPLDMPRAEAYLVREGGRRYLEDRFDRLDLWSSRAVDGRWLDDEGRVFVCSALRECPPQEISESSVSTRAEYVRSAGPVKRDDLERRRRAVELLSPVEVAEEPERPRQIPRGFRDVEYWQGTNETAVVCAFLPEKEETWRIATWLLAEGDEFDAAKEAFEEAMFSGRDSTWSQLKARLRRPEKKPERRGRAKKGPPPDSPAFERELLRADARHSVAAYPSWHTTDAEEFTVLDELPDGSAFVSSLTNELAVMRRRYAAAVPTPLDGTNVLCVARIFASRDRYLDALEADGLTNMTWTAAYWSPVRRELVGYLPREGAAELLKTVRHEAFHQYLTYACSTIAASPWLNEGYAQYFEEGPDGPDAPDFSDLAGYSAAVAPLMDMDYGEFYSGSDAERRLKYRLALSVACFLERGAPRVRFDPFRGLKGRYVEALFETKDMRRATAAAFENEDQRRLFAAEWRKYCMGELR